MSRISRQDVIGLLGELDDLTVSQLIATGVDASTLVAALRRVQHEVQFGTRIPESQAPESDRVREILLEVLDDDFGLDFATD